MIKYYDTNAAYEADVKSAFESQVSLIGADNAIKFDGRNVIVDIHSAKTGSIVVLDGLHAMRFVSVETFSSASFMSNFEIMGVVRVGVDHPSFRGQIVIGGRHESRVASEIYSYRLTGFVCDGTDRSGTLSIRDASDSWAANRDYVISYNASSESELTSQLNEYFRNNEPFAAQEWQAVLNSDNTIDLIYQYKAWQQSSYNSAKSGFALAHNLFPDWAATSNMLRRNGMRSGSGTITNLSRALAYFRNDSSSTSFNPSANVLTKKISYPICLPAYLGTSKYQSDHCAYLRSIYGEGETGWLKFMESFLPVRPTSFGSNGDKAKYGDSRKNTYYLASQKYTDINGILRPASPAAAYVASYGFDHELASKGNWVWGDSDLLFDLVGGLEYGTTNDPYADAYNGALKTIGWPALSNGSSVWSSSRYDANNGWYTSGGGGFANGYNLFYSCLVVPLLLLSVPQSAI